jgi:hypothetical protein
VVVNPEASPGHFAHALSLCQQDRDIQFKRLLKERPKPTVLKAQIKLELHDATSELPLLTLLRKMPNKDVGEGVRMLLASTYVCCHSWIKRCSPPLPSGHV